MSEESQTKIKCEVQHSLETLFILFKNADMNHSNNLTESFMVKFSPQELIYEFWVFTIAYGVTVFWDPNHIEQ